MPHIHTDPGHHDTTVTAFVVRVEDGQPRVLLHMHRKFGKLMPPGGHIELSETPWAALAHELEEEAGYTLADVDVLQPKARMKTVSRVVMHPQPFLSNTHPIDAGHSHVDLDYALVAEDLPKRPPAEGESTDLRWLTADEVRALPPEATWINVKEMILYIFDEILPSEAWERVPATAYSLESPSGE